MTTPSAGLTLAIALAAGVLAQSVSRQLRLPGIVLLLAVGAVLGPEGLAWIAPRSLGEGLFGIVEFGVAIILFEGGLSLEWSRLRRQEASIRRLVTLGALVTLCGGTLLARTALGWTWNVSLLFGSLVVVTGPTVVAPLLSGLRLHPRPKTILEAEGVLIDPMGALLAVFMLQIVTNPAVSTLAFEIGTVAASLAFGLVVGLLAGLGLTFALRHRVLIARGYETIATLAFVVLLFEVCDQVIETSGLLAVTVAGIVVGNMETRVNDELREFKDRLTILLVGLLFVLLAADVALVDVRSLGAGGLVVVGGLILVVRPAGVWLSTRGLNLSRRERVFVAAIGPRGIVAAAIASLTAATLAERGLAGGDSLAALVFLTIAITVVLSGAIAWPLAWLLDLQLPGRDRVAIAGATGLAVAMARELRAANVPVVFLESDPKRSRMVEEDGFSVIFGDPLEERTMLRARAELIGTAVGLTFSEHFNGLFVRNAVDEFHVPRGYVAMESLYGEKTPSLVKQPETDVLFDGPRDHERWDTRWRHDQVSVERFEYRPAPEVETESSEERNDGAGPTPARSLDRFVILTVARGKRVKPMHAGYSLREGDVSAVAIFTPERVDALAALTERGWRASPSPRAHLG